MSCLLEMDVYFQNIALAASAEAIYRPQKGSGANTGRQIATRASLEFPRRQRESWRGAGKPATGSLTTGRASFPLQNAAAVLGTQTRWGKRNLGSLLRVPCHWHESNGKNRNSLVFEIDHCLVFLSPNKERCVFTSVSWITEQSEGLSDLPKVTQLLNEHSTLALEIITSEDLPNSYFFHGLHWLQIWKLVWNLKARTKQNKHPGFKINTFLIKKRKPKQHKNPLKTWRLSLIIGLRIPKGAG